MHNLIIGKVLKYEEAVLTDLILINIFLLKICSISKKKKNDSDHKIHDRNEIIFHSFKIY